MSGRPHVTSVSPRQIIVVDDHPLFRKSISVLLEQQADLQFAGEAEEHSSALQLIEQVHPDLMLADLNLKEGSGLSLIKEVTARFPWLKVLVVSGFEDKAYVERSLRAGARGFLGKTATVDEILAAMRTVLAGEVFLNESLRNQLLIALIGQKAKGPLEAERHLTDREFEVLGFYARGLSTREIAAQLHLSEKTVGTHRASIMKKRSLTNSREFLQFAIEWWQEQTASARN